GIIVSIFAREEKFKYEFQKGKPWRHETLIAPFDFPIAKTPLEIEEETQEINENKKLYFSKKVGAKEQSVVDFSEELDENFPAFLTQLLAVKDDEEEKKKIKEEISREDSASIKLNIKRKGVEILEHLY